MPNCQIFRIIRRYLYWLNFLQVNFCYCSYPWIVQLTRVVLHLDISFIYWFIVIRVLFCIFWSLCSWTIQWSRRQGTRKYHNSWRVSLEGLSNMSPRRAYFIQEAFFFLIKSKTSSLGATLLQPQIVRISKLSIHQIKGILLYVLFHPYECRSSFNKNTNMHFIIWERHARQLWLMLISICLIIILELLAGMAYSQLL